MDCDNYSCVICLNIADKAVETSCCQRLFCHTCLSRLMVESCPMCHEDFEIVVNHKAREFIGTMEVNCRHKGCSLSFARSTVQDHERTCMHRIFKCPAPRCAYEGDRENYASHLLSEHEDEVIEGSHFILDDKMKLERESDESFAITVNDVGRPARLGSTGKFYCRARLGRPRCSCDGYCGPTNGCNCKSCMKLDIASRGLQPNWYVNKEGAVCRKSEETGRFHCGRRHWRKKYCGPSIGDSCYACQEICKQYNTRYPGIWEFPLETVHSSTSREPDLDDFLHEAIF